MRPNRSFGALLALLIALGLLSSCAERGQAPTKSFEGTITEVIQMPGLADLMQGDSSNHGADNGVGAMVSAMANVNLKMYFKGGKVAYDVSSMGGLINVHSIVNRDARTLTVLMPGKTAVVVDLRKMDSLRGRLDDSINAHPSLFDSILRMLPKPTGKTEKIQGLDAAEYTATKGDFTNEVWLSDDPRIQVIDIVRDAILGRQRTGGGGIEQMFAMLQPVDGKLPVKFETKYRGKVLVTGGLRSVEEGNVDDAVFAVPKDYRIINQDSMRMAHPVPLQPAPNKSEPRTYTGPREG